MMKKAMVLLLGCLYATGVLACYAESCNGLPPEKHRNICPVSFKKSVYINGYSRQAAILTIKYSKKCNANWAVLETNGISYSTSDPRLLSVGVQDMRTGQVLKYTGAPGLIRDGGVYMGEIMSSPMISGRNKVRALGSFKQFRDLGERLANKQGEGFTYPKVFHGVTPAY